MGFGVFGFLPSTDTIIHPKPRKVNPFFAKKCSLYTFTDNTIFSRSFLLKVNKRGRGWDKLEGLDGGGVVSGKSWEKFSPMRHGDKRSYMCIFQPRYSKLPLLVFSTPIFHPTHLCSFPNSKFSCPRKFDFPHNL